MTKLCARGKKAAKAKFKVYPSAYANAYASKICAGKIKDPSGVKRKDFKGPKPASAKEGMMTEFKKKRKKSQEAYKRRARKNQQRNPSKTMFKGKDIEITFTDINPFTDSVEFKRPYGPGRGISYPVQQTSAQRASDKRFESFKDIVREVDKFKTSKIKKKSSPASAKQGMMTEIEKEAQKRKDIKKTRDMLMKAREEGGRFSKSDIDIATKQAKKLRKSGRETGGRLSVSDVEKLMDAMPNFNVGGHSVMGSPVSVDVDGDTLNNPSASAYYKDLLK